MRTKNQQLLSDERPFSYLITKDQDVFISWHGSLRKRLNGQDASRFIAKVQFANAAEAQLIMARITGNFKRGNESKSDCP